MSAVHRRRRDQLVVAELVARRVAGREVGARAQQELEHERGPAVADELGADGRKGRTRCVAADREACRVTAEGRRVLPDPAQRGQAVVDRGGERVLRRGAEPDRDDEAAGGAGEEPAHRVRGRDAPDREAPAVEVDEDGLEAGASARCVGVRCVDAHREVAAGPGEHAIVDRGHRVGRGVPHHRRGRLEALPHLRVAEPVVEHAATRDRGEDRFELGVEIPGHQRLPPPVAPAGPPSADALDAAVGDHEQPVVVRCDGLDAVVVHEHEILGVEHADLG